VRQCGENLVFFPIITLENEVLRRFAPQNDTSEMILHTSPGFSCFSTFSGAPGSNPCIYEVLQSKREIAALAKTARKKRSLAMTCPVNSAKTIHRFYMMEIER
jgi:hypothetical protein